MQKRRASLNDFDRFKIMLAKIKVCNTSTFLFCIISLLSHFVVSLDGERLKKGQSSFSALKKNIDLINAKKGFVDDFFY